MTILSRIEADLLTARRAGNATVRDALSFLLSESRAPGKNNGNRDSTDAEVIVVIRKLLTGANDTVSALAGTPRESEIAAVEAYIALLSEYLPAQLSLAQLTAEITKLIADQEPSPKLIGVVMGKLKTEWPGQFDPAEASRIARLLMARE
jgi:uncharacterized protein YqeY